jgi:hypothetical protein
MTKDCTKPTVRLLYAPLYSITEQDRQKAVK